MLLNDFINLALVLLIQIANHGYNALFLLQVQRTRFPRRSRVLLISGLADGRRRATWPGSGTFR